MRAAIITAVMTVGLMAGSVPGQADAAVRPAVVPMPAGCTAAAPQILSSLVAWPLPGGGQNIPTTTVVSFGIACTPVSGYVVKSTKMSIQEKNLNATVVIWQTEVIKPTTPIDGGDFVMLACRHAPDSPTCTPGIQGPRRGKIQYTLIGPGGVQVWVRMFTPIARPLQ
jgi:hypothetical protein